MQKLLPEPKVSEAKVYFRAQYILPVQDASVAIDAVSIIGILIFVSIVCAVTAYLSARKAANLNVVQCLQAE